MSIKIYGESYFRGRTIVILCLKLRIDGGEGRHASVRYARPIILPDQRLWSRFGFGVISQFPTGSSNANCL